MRSTIQLNFKDFQDKTFKMNRDIFVKIDNTEEPLF